MNSDKYSSKEKIQLGNILNQIGIIYYSEGNYSNAMTIFLESQSLCEAAKSDSLLADVLKNIGNIYSSYSDFEKGEECYLKALVLIKDKNHLKLENKILTNLFGVSYFMKDKSDAEKYYQRLIANKPVDERQTFDFMVNKGLLFILNKDYNNAKDCFQTSLDYAIKHSLDSLKTIGVANSQIAHVYRLEGKIDSAIMYLRKNEVVANNTNAQDLKVETFKDLYLAYKELGDKSKADQYHESYLNLSDSIFNMNEFNRLKNAQVLYEMNKSNQIINSLIREQDEYEAEISTQRIILAAVFSALSIFLVLSIVVYKQKRKIENAYKDLFLKNKEFINSEYKNKRRILDYDLQLKQAWKKISELRQEGYIHKDEEEAPDAYISKDYLLSTEQRDAIIRNIDGIMDNTKEFCEFDFTLNKLANMIGSNTRYVSFIINDVYGKNFKTYLNEYRIKEAMIRLLDAEVYGSYTIKAIAESVGYRSQTNFIVVFKKITGLPPSVYQKLALKNHDLDKSIL